MFFQELIGSTAFLIGLVLVLANLAYCAITSRILFAAGNRRLATFGLVAAAGSILPLGWVVWVLSVFTTWRDPALSRRPTPRPARPAGWRPD